MAHLEIGSYDVVGITEMWLQEDQNWELNHQGYTSNRNDRQVGRGNGVALLARDKIQCLSTFQSTH